MDSSVRMVCDAFFVEIDVIEIIASQASLRLK